MDAKILLRCDSTTVAKLHLHDPEIAEHGENLALQLLEQVESNIEKITSATRWIENSHLAESALKVLDEFSRFCEISGSRDLARRDQFTYLHSD